MVISDFTLALFSALCLLPIQKAVNRHNQKLSPGNKPLSKFLFGEKITISVSLLLTVLSFVIGYKKESGESFFNQTENMFLTTMYVHEQVYPEICKNTVTKCADILKFSAAYFPPNAHVLNKH